MNYIHLDEDTILQPFYTSDVQGCRSVQTMIARLDGERVIPLHVSNALTNNEARGFLEPHIAEYAGWYYMTVRAEDGRGYIMTSEDGGRSWNSPQPWKWDNGEEIPMDTTMTKLLSHSEGLVLVYTRIRSDNVQYFRSRTPLHCAEIDPGSLTLRRSTERIIVPNCSTGTGRGALSLGNFWVWPVSQEKLKMSLNFFGFLQNK